MLCVMVGEYNGFVADSVSRLNATTYRFDTKPKDKIKTIRDYQSEDMLKPALEAMNGAVASITTSTTATAKSVWRCKMARASAPECAWVKASGRPSMTRPLSASKVAAWTSGATRPARRR